MVMAVLPIRKYGDPILRRKATPVSKMDDYIRSLIGDMFDTIRGAKGVGLAAPQVGESISLIVVDISRVDRSAQPLVLVNPKVVEERGDRKWEEGCLSIPDVHEEITRAEFVVVEGLDQEGSPLRVEGKGMLARALQHEIDHVNGVLIIDRVSPVRRHLLRARLRKLAKEQLRTSG